MFNTNYSLSGSYTSQQPSYYHDYHEGPAPARDWAPAPAPFEKYQLSAPAPSSSAGRGGYNHGYEESRPPWQSHAEGAGWRNDYSPSAPEDFRPPPAAAPSRYDRGPEDFNPRQDFVPSFNERSYSPPPPVSARHPPISTRQPAPPPTRLRTSFASASLTRPRRGSVPRGDLPGISRHEQQKIRHAHERHDEEHDRNGSLDSGYGSSERKPSVPAKATGKDAAALVSGGVGSYFGWDMLKKAVGYGDAEAAEVIPPPPAFREDFDPHSSHTAPRAAPAPPRRGSNSALGGYWSKFTSKISHTVTDWAFDEQDCQARDADGEVGEDGETLLGRAIRKYHFSHAESPEDIPEWLLGESELATRRRHQREPSVVNYEQAQPTRRRRSSLAELAFGRRRSRAQSRGGSSEDQGPARRGSRREETMYSVKEEDPREDEDEQPTGSWRAPPSKAAARLKLLRDNSARRFR